MPAAALPNDHCLYFDSVNRNKQSVCIDLYLAEECEILEKLIVGSDVLVENFKAPTVCRGLSLPRLHGEPQIRRARTTRVDDV